MPRMIVVAGPPGGGKSTVFPVNSFGVEAFNADDRAAALNKGSYRSLLPSVRSTVNKEFEAFVEYHINTRRSFAFETTLRTGVTLRQAGLAKAEGFTVAMNYLAMGSLEEHLERVAARAEGGGHAASFSTLSGIYQASLKNLPSALRSLDTVEVFDNSALGQRPRLGFECGAETVRCSIKTNLFLRLLLLAHILKWRIGNDNEITPFRIDHDTVGRCEDARCCWRIGQPLLQYEHKHYFDGSRH